MKKTTALKNLITSAGPEFIMEAHNGVSAKIAEEAGFAGIWASSLSISASLGVRDNNEASWTQILEILDFMNDAAGIPILFDGDTGYGNFNNVRRLVKKLGQIDIAGICIEDKIFPKTNSFIRSETQPLASIDEFCGKIKAACDVRRDADFVVVARTEAFIAGYGLDEALKRADAYREAGADAILVHSKKSTVSDIEAFMREWGNKLPVVIVPTKYYSTPTEKFRAMNISLVIWANHLIRASVTYMQKIARQIKNDESLINIEDRVIPVSELFRLQGDDELREAEKRYLPASGKNINAVVLAAARGDFGELTGTIPKAMLKVGGKPVLAGIIDNLNSVGVKDVTVVRGFAADKINFTNIKNIDNLKYSETTELYSLYLALGEIGEDTIVCYGDIIFKSYVLTELINSPHDIVAVADADFEIDGRYRDFVKTDAPYSKKHFSGDAGFVKMSADLPAGEINGEFIGMLRVSGKGAAALREVLKKLSAEAGFEKMRMNALLNEVSKSFPVFVKFIKGTWLDINQVIDLQKAGEI